MYVLLCFQLMQNIHFNLNTCMYNFKLNFLLQGQLMSLNLAMIFLLL